MGKRGGVHETGKNRGKDRQKAEQWKRGWDMRSWDKRRRWPGVR